MKSRTLLVLFTLSTVAACATMDEEPETVVEPVMVQIESFSGGMEGVTVHLLPPLGEREFMGTLPTDGMTWFDVEGPILPGEYRLVAESPDGLTVASRPFFLRGSGVRWNITSNAVVPIGWATTAD